MSASASPIIAASQSADPASRAARSRRRRAAGGAAGLGRASGEEPERLRLAGHQAAGGRARSPRELAPGGVGAGGVGPASRSSVDRLEHRVEPGASSWGSGTAKGMPAWRMRVLRHQPLGHGRGEVGTPRRCALRRATQISAAPRSSAGWAQAKREPEPLVREGGLRRRQPLGEERERGGRVVAGAAAAIARRRRRATVISQPPGSAAPARRAPRRRLGQRVLGRRRRGSARRARPPARSCAARRRPPSRVDPRVDPGASVGVHPLTSPRPGASSTTPWLQVGQRAAQPSAASRSGVSIR